jgi:hypothetical protein
MAKTSKPVVTEMTTRALLGESFEVLAREMPTAWDRMCKILEGCAVILHIEDEHFSVRFSGRSTKLTSALDESPDATVETTIDTIVAVLDAELSLHEALMGDRLRVKASLPLILRLYDAIITYVHGGVRCASFPPIFDRFRRMVSDRRDQGTHHD